MHCKNASSIALLGSAPVSESFASSFTAFGAFCGGWEAVGEWFYNVFREGCLRTCVFYGVCAKEEEIRRIRRRRKRRKKKK